MSRHSRRALRRETGARSRTARAWCSARADGFELGVEFLGGPGKALAVAGKADDADHQDDVDVRILTEKLGALLFGLAGKGDDISPLEHRPEVSPVGHGRRSHDVRKMRTVGVEDVIVPVRL